MQTILIHHQDIFIQNKRKLYSEPPSYRSVSDRVKKNKALLNGQCWFLFVLIFHLRTVTEVAEWVFKGLLNAQMNKSWPWMFPFRFPFSGVVEERTWELLGSWVIRLCFQNLRFPLLLQQNGCTFSWPQHFPIAKRKTELICSRHGSKFPQLR